MADQWQTGVIAAPATDKCSPANQLVVLEDSGVGSGSFLTGQQNAIGTGATMIVAARLGTPGIGRKYLNVTNTGAQAVFVGPPGVTITNGSRIYPQQTRQIETTQQLDGVVASGVGTVDFDETI